jgi:hypothetical protein
MMTSSGPIRPAGFIELVKGDKKDHRNSPNGGPNKNYYLSLLTNKKYRSCHTK